MREFASHETQRKDPYYVSDCGRTRLRLTAAAVAIVGMQDIIMEVRFICPISS
jgi:hypothetical protein